MEIFQFVGLALITTVLIVTVKQLEGMHIGVLISVVFGAIIFLLLIGKIGYFGRTSGSSKHKSVLFSNDFKSNWHSLHCGVWGSGLP